MVVPGCEQREAARPVRVAGGTHPALCSALAWDQGHCSRSSDRPLRPPPDPFWEPSRAPQCPGPANCARWEEPKALETIKEAKLVKLGWHPMDMEPHTGGHTTCHWSLGCEITPFCFLCPLPCSSPIPSAPEQAAEHLLSCAAAGGLWLEELSWVPQPPGAEFPLAWPWGSQNPAWPRP